MNPMMIQAALAMLQSGKLDGLFSGIPGFDKLKGLTGQDAKPLTVIDEVAMAVSVLVNYCPADPEKAKAYGLAIADIVQSAGVVKMALKG